MLQYIETIKYQNTDLLYCSERKAVRFSIGTIIERIIFFGKILIVTYLRSL